MSSTIPLFSTIKNEDELLTRDQAAQYLGISPATLAVWASTGRYTLPYVKYGKHVKYRKEELDAFIKRQTVNQYGDKWDK